MSLIGLLVALIIICLLYWAVQAILRAFGIGEPVSTVVKVAFVIIIVLWLLGQVGGVSLPALR